nr:uncharacterized protein LOC119164703 [Rhipicephalus microplus]
MTRSLCLFALAAKSCRFNPSVSITTRVASKVRKRQFRLHEQGYDYLRFFSRRLDSCITPYFLHICVDINELKNCALERPHVSQRLRDFRKQSYALVEDFTACVDRALERCDNDTEADNLNFVKLVLTATSNLNWFDEGHRARVYHDSATTTTVYRRTVDLLGILRPTTKETATSETMAASLHVP